MLARFGEQNKKKMPKYFNRSHADKNRKFCSRTPVAPVELFENTCIVYKPTSFIASSVSDLILTEMCRLALFFVVFFYFSGDVAICRHKTYSYVFVMWELFGFSFPL